MSAGWVVPLITAASGLGGVVLGGAISLWNETRRRQLAFLEKQLSELYSPLLAARREVRFLSELRVRVATATGAVWEDLCREANQTGDPIGALQRMRAARKAEFDKVIEYENEQWRNYLLPAYERMAALLKEKFWLAEDSTREHLTVLLEYIELWKRSLGRTIPMEAVAQLDVREAKLAPLYNDLDKTFATLRRELTAGKRVARRWRFL